MTTYLESVLDDLKYLNRLNRHEFCELLFPQSEEYYQREKWDSWTDNPLHFLWGCSYDKLEILIGYINECKGESE